jgi:hypothetical protein
VLVLSELEVNFGKREREMPAHHGAIVHGPSVPAGVSHCTSRSAAFLSLPQPHARTILTARSNLQMRRFDQAFILTSNDSILLIYAAH